jgi:hypothetical protein
VIQQRVNIGSEQNTICWVVSPRVIAGIRDQVRSLEHFGRATAGNSASPVAGHHCVPKRALILALLDEAHDFSVVQP